MAVNSWQMIAMEVQTDQTRKVDHIDVEIVKRDHTGIVNFTDIMLQSGTVATTWVGHVSEIRWSFDNA